MELNSSHILRLYPRESNPYGLTYEEWSIKWWRWLLKIPIKNNPAFDPTGKNAYIYQNNPFVFFLCQTFDNSGFAPIRNVTVQKGRSLFLPIINWISVSPQDGVTDEDLFQKAQNKMNSIENLDLNLNGERIDKGLEEYRVKSHVFDVTLPTDNILKLGSGEWKVVSDGYWILTEAVTVPIYLTTFGSCSSGLTNIGVRYNIQVT